MESHKFKIKFITPVHIGDGEEIDSLNYIVEKNYFYRINLEKFIFELNDNSKKDFMNLIDKKNMVELRAYIKANCDFNKYSVYKARLSVGFKEKYKKGFNSIKNNLAVNSFIKTGSMVPFIPGSSLKGSVRTAVLNYLLEKNRNEISKIDFFNITDNRGNRIKGSKAKIIESAILGMPLNHFEPKFDPFRFLYISDYSLEKNNFYIGKASSKSWNMFYEVPLNIKDESLNSYGELTLSNERAEKLNTYNNNFRSIKKVTDFDLIKKACKWFYEKIALEEYDKFYKTSQDYNNEYDRINREFNNLKDNEIILRCGKNSQFESMTLVGFENLKPKKFGKSRNIFENGLPMGWLKLIFD